MRTLGLFLSLALGLLALAISPKALADIIGDGADGAKPGSYDPPKAQPPKAKVKPAKKVDKTKKPPKPTPPKGKKATVPHHECIGDHCRGGHGGFRLDSAINQPSTEAVAVGLSSGSDCDPAVKGCLIYPKEEKPKKAKKQPRVRWNGGILGWVPIPRPYYGSVVFF